MDKEYMKMVLQLAEKGWGKTRPNPLVGALVIKDNKIISEGYHRYYGGDHAELDALKKIDFNGEGADLYVNLEPCSHYGKTPPCVEAIIKGKIKRVVVGMMDPNPLVAGKGIKILQEHGIQVVTGVLEEEAKKLNEVFIKYITKKQPFVILKTAMTLDGKIATSTGDSRWISGNTSREYVHHIRDRVSGIMVGVNTVMRDNPQLNTRIPGREVSQPIRIIVDSQGRVPIDSQVITTAQLQPTIIATTEKTPAAKLAQLKEHHVEVIQLPSKNDRVDLKELMKELGRRQIDSILLEGGGTLNFEALETGIVDKVISFIAPKIIGGKDALTPVEGRGRERISEAITLKRLTVKALAEDILVEGYIEGND